MCNSHHGLVLISTCYIGAVCIARWREEYRPRRDADEQRRAQSFDGVLRNVTSSARNVTTPIVAPASDRVGMPDPLT